MLCCESLRDARPSNAVSSPYTPARPVLGFAMQRGARPCSAVPSRFHTVAPMLFAFPLCFAITLSTAFHTGCNAL